MLQVCVSETHSLSLSLWLYLRKCRFPPPGESIKARNGWRRSPRASAPTRSVKVILELAAACCLLLLLVFKGRNHVLSAEAFTNLLLPFHPFNLVVHWAGQERIRFPCECDLKRYASSTRFFFSLNFFERIAKNLRVDMLWNKFYSPCDTLHKDFVKIVNEKHQNQSLRS